MKPSQVIPAKCRGYLLNETTFAYDQLNSSIYALGVGCCRDPYDEEELNFTYSLSDNFKVLPTFPVVLGLASDMFEAISSCPGLPDFNPMMLLHGEQKIEVFSVLPPTLTGKARASIVDVQDKKSGALVLIQADLVSTEGAPVAKCLSKIFIRGIGGFGDAGIINDRIQAAPKRLPDLTHTEQTSPSQAVIYQLSGDKNPLHISKDMAALGNFELPILHGLCTMGFGSRAVLRHVLNFDVAKFRSISVRFTSHVFPGETLITDMWKEGNQVIFSMKTAERGLQVVQGVIETTEAPASRL